LKWLSTVHVLVPEEFQQPASTFRVWQSGKRYRAKDCIRTTSSEFSNLNLGTLIDSWNSAAGLMYPLRFCIATFCSPEAGNFSPHHRVQTDSGAHPASYQMGAGGSFPGSKEAGAWSWPLTSILCRDQECVELYLHSPNTPSWRDAQLKQRDNFAFTLSRRCLLAIESTIPGCPIYGLVTIRTEHLRVTANIVCL
jgi:hypothetical protein